MFNYMFNYFRNCSSNPIKFCYEDSPTKGLVCMIIASPMTLAIIQGHKCISNLTYKISQIKQESFDLSFRCEIDRSLMPLMVHACSGH